MQTAESLARRRAGSLVGVRGRRRQPEAAALYERLGYARTGIVARSEYDFVDENGVEQHAVEWNEYLIMDLEVTTCWVRSRPARSAAQ